MKNEYWEEAKKFKEKITSYLYTIFKVYGNELTLRLEDYNLLKEKDNCIESSTAIGFILEEFIFSKLKVFTQDNLTQDGEYKIERKSKATISSSYDFFSILKDNSLCMINLKTAKKINNAIAAINILHSDYVVENKEIPKHFMIIKVIYEYIDSTVGERRILIKSIDSFYLEELNLDLNVHQDHRNWSKIMNLNSGRLIISSVNLKMNKLDEMLISYDKTSKAIDAIFNNNKAKEDN